MGITHLTFGNNFNQPVNNLPLGITHLTFDGAFNQSVNNLPLGVTHLSFGFQFNQPVDCLPPSITHLTFGCNFNQSVNNLSQFITHLRFGLHFAQSVTNLPPSLIFLQFGSSMELDTFVCKLPKSLIYLHLYKNTYFREDAPPTFCLDFPHLKSLHLHYISAGVTIELPPSLTELDLGVVEGNIDRINIPTLKKLRLGQLDAISNLPESVESLTLCDSGPINNLPPSLKFLKLKEFDS